MLKIYNTLTRKKEEFIPLKGNKVNMYACGITVSGDAHIGHVYQALIYDVIRKYLIKAGFDVTYARNYTDVDDKIIAKANELNVKADVYAAQMIDKINAVMKKLEIDDPDIWLKATCNIDNIISFVQKLIDGNHAYPTEKGDVYFAVESFKGYGKLSNRNLEDAIEGVRIDNDDFKKNPLDFALWKSAKPGEIYWDSPWGKGRPGWHIECSTMNMVAFGEQIDIHGGGRDLIFPHHENEIAQTEALTGKQFSKYWIHNGLIKVNGQKMSKSLGNSILATDLLEKYNPEVIKFALLLTNYRNDINVTETLFPEAEKHLTDFYKIIATVEATGEKVEGGNKTIDDEFNAAMDDDFNTAKAIANLFGYFKTVKTKIKNGDKTYLQDISQIRKTYSLLGIFKRNAKEFLSKMRNEENTPAVEDSIPSEVLELVEKRKQAKLNRDYALADSLRDEITKFGYAVTDTKDGVKIEKI